MIEYYSLIIGAATFSFNVVAVIALNYKILNFTYRG